jgi:hypothetical protein
MKYIKFTKLSLIAFALISGFNFGFSKGSPGGTTDGDWQMLVSSLGQSGLGNCSIVNPVFTASNTANTNTNRGSLYFPSYIAVKALVVFVPFSGQRVVVATSEFIERDTGGTSVLGARASEQFNCFDFSNLGGAMLGYGYHAARPSDSDPRPGNGARQLYSGPNGYTSAISPF